MRSAAPPTAFSKSPDTALGSYIDLPFNASLSIILVLTYACVTRSRSFLLLVVLVVSATIASLDEASTAGEMAKIMCELPLGLGSVLAFLCLRRRVQVRLLPAFTIYVNCAVYGNIAMMVGTPADGTLRGLCSKVTCAALSLWALQQGRRAGWKTVSLHGPLFVFTAVSKSWIVAHAIYRFVLLTLPCFGSGRRYRLLELYSLAFTSALSWAVGLPWEHCFGMADTLVVPAAAGWSAMARIFDLLPDSATRTGLPAGSDPFGADADACLGLVSVAVAMFACFQIARGAEPSRDARSKQDQRLYGLEHGRLNMVATPTTMWMNIGFWCVATGRRGWGVRRFY